MTVTLDHTIVQASNNLASAQFLADILGVPGPDTPAHFTPVLTDNDVALDFMTVGRVLPHHYAFRMTPAQFDEAYERVRAQGLAIFARPDRSGEGEIYRRDGRRGFYFDDPDENLMELIEKSEDEVDREVRELATRWAAAEVGGDVAALDGLLAEEFCGVGPFGFVLDKSAWLNRFASGLKNEALSFSELQVLPFGCSAIVVAVLDQKTTFNDADSSGRYRVSFVANRHGGRWKIASCHIGPLDPRAVNA
jgi:ketosteroid isomerase-like protein/catechol 2,3-dioxygenase-like lactoylglutathione lyase family enzyme